MGDRLRAAAALAVALIAAAIWLVLFALVCLAWFVLAMVLSFGATGWVLLGSCRRAFRHRRRREVPPWAG